jgi:hypothetical protein
VIRIIGRVLTDHFSYANLSRVQVPSSNSLKPVTYWRHASFLCAGTRSCTYGLISGFRRLLGKPGLWWKSCATHCVLKDKRAQLSRQPVFCGSRLAGDADQRHHHQHNRNQNPETLEGANEISFPYFAANGDHSFSDTERIPLPDKTGSSVLYFWSVGANRKIGYFRLARHSDTTPPLGRLRLQESQSKREKYQGALASPTQRSP